MLGKGTITVEQSSDQHFFNSFASTDKTKNMTDGTVVVTKSCVV